MKLASAVASSVVFIVSFLCQEAHEKRVEPRLLMIESGAAACDLVQPHAIKLRLPRAACDGRVSGRLTGMDNPRVRARQAAGYSLAERVHEIGNPTPASNHRAFLFLELDSGFPAIGTPIRSRIGSPRPLKPIAL